MSTRSRIAVVLKDRSKGVELMPNVELLQHKLFREAKGEGKLYPSKFDGNIVSIYHHWDGYPEGVGTTLLNEFNDYDKALNLMLFGDASSINDEDKLSFYNYWRDEDWEGTKPRIARDEEQLMEVAESGWGEYVYIYKPNELDEYEWYVCDMCEGKREFHKLKDVLSGKEQD